jgi:4-hydroxy-3-methylbut-2-enyl diphosphate reductase
VSELLIAAPLALEEALIRSTTRGAHVRKTGMGPNRSREAARALLEEPGEALLVLGFCGGLDEQAAPGEVIVAEQRLGAPDEGHGSERVACRGAAELAAALSRAGLEVRTGAIVCVSKIATGERRKQLAEGGAIAVDMESVWLAAGAGDRPFGVVRIVLDSPSHELLRPAAALSAVRAARALRRAAGTLHEWAPAG